VGLRASAVRASPAGASARDPSGPAFASPGVPASPSNVCSSIPRTEAQPPAPNEQARHVNVSHRESMRGPCGVVRVTIRDMHTPCRQIRGATGEVSGRKRGGCRSARARRETRDMCHVTPAREVSRDTTPWRRAVASILYSDQAHLGAMSRHVACSRAPPCSDPPACWALPSWPSSRCGRQSLSGDVRAAASSSAREMLREVGQGSRQGSRPPSWPVS
jgi:hypothetical protein